MNIYCTFELYVPFGNVDIFLSIILSLVQNGQVARLRRSTKFDPSAGFHTPIMEVRPEPESKEPTNWDAMATSEHEGQVRGKERGAKSIPRCYNYRVAEVSAIGTSR